MPGHTVVTAFERGWSTLQNGDLLRTAEADFDLLITTDRNLRYQQNLTGRRLGILVLPTTSWPVIRGHVEEIAAAVPRIPPAGYEEMKW